MKKYPYIDLYLQWKTFISPPKKKKNFFLTQTLQQNPSLKIFVLLGLIHLHLSKFIRVAFSEIISTKYHDPLKRTSGHHYQMLEHHSSFLTCKNPATNLYLLHVVTLTLLQIVLLTKAAKCMQPHFWQSQVLVGSIITNHRTTPCY